MVTIQFQKHIASIITHLLLYMRRVLDGRMKDTFYAREGELLKPLTKGKIEFDEKWDKYVALFYWHTSLIALHDTYPVEGHFTDIVDKQDSYLVGWDEVDTEYSTRPRDIRMVKRIYNFMRFICFDFVNG